jgi:hypothetical protein
MNTENNEKIRERILSLIDTEFESDAAFERALGLKDKTVNNWRRGRSASYMKMLPVLSERFSVNIGELLDIPLSAEGDQLSEEEIALLTLYRKSHVLPKKMRRALTETLESTINMYIAAGESRKKK